MLVKYEDREWELDLDEMDVKQARVIKAATGLTPLAVQRGMVEVDPDALVALYWYMKVSAGERCDIKRVNFKIAEFSGALSDALIEGLSDEEREDLEEATGLEIPGKSEDSPKE